jgi:hypothetical protein
MIEQWVGWKNGRRIAVYPQRALAEHALAQYHVDSISPEPAGTIAAEFTLVDHARIFAAHIEGPGWHIEPGSIKHDGKYVRWMWTGDIADRAAYWEHVNDLAETAGTIGASPDGTYKAYVNGTRAPIQY